MRLVVWGLGPHAINNILPAVGRAKGLELYGVCSRSKAAVSESATRFACHGWTTPARMLRDPLVEIVYVATPIGLHAEHGKAVLAARKHLWCEKSLTSRLADTREILDSSRRLRLSVCEGHMYLHHPQFLKLSRLVSGGWLGRILSVWCGFGFPQLERPSFRTDPRLGGGALFDVGSYPISAIHALFPRDAQTVKYSTMSSRDGLSVDTDGQCVIDIENGATATLEWRINCAYRNELHVWGEHASLVADKVFSKPPDFRPSLRLHDLHGVETIEYVEAANHFVLMLEAFRNRVDDEAAMENERDAIARRAATIDQIWSTFSVPSAGPI